VPTCATTRRENKCHEPEHQAAYSPYRPTPWWHTSCRINRARDCPAAIFLSLLKISTAPPPLFDANSVLARFAPSDAICKTVDSSIQRTRVRDGRDARGCDRPRCSVRCSPLRCRTGCGVGTTCGSVAIEASSRTVGPRLLLRRTPAGGPWCVRRTAHSLVPQTQGSAARRTARVGISYILYKLFMLYLLCLTLVLSMWSSYLKHHVLAEVATNANDLHNVLV
jgi:hypothetical protein